MECRSECSTKSVGEFKKGRSLHRPFERLQNGLLQDAPGWRIMVG